MSRAPDFIPQGKLLAELAHLRSRQHDWYNEETGNIRTDPAAMAESGVHRRQESYSSLPDAVDVLFTPTLVDSTPSSSSCTTHSSLPHVSSPRKHPYILPSSPSPNLRGCSSYLGHQRRQEPSDVVGTQHGSGERPAHLLALLSFAL